MERYLADALGHFAFHRNRSWPGPATARRPSPRGSRRWAALSLILGIALAGELTWRFLFTGTSGDGPGDTTDHAAVATAQTDPAQDRQTETEAELVPAPRPEPTSAPQTSPPEDPVARRAATDLIAGPVCAGRSRCAWFERSAAQGMVRPRRGTATPHPTLPPPKARRDRPAPTTEIERLWRLRTPWKTGSALRCLFRTVDTLKFHVWNGTEGVTLELWRTATKNANLSDTEPGSLPHDTKGKGAAARHPGAGGLGRGRVRPHPDAVRIDGKRSPDFHADRPAARGRPADGELRRRRASSACPSPRRRPRSISRERLPSRPSALLRCGSAAAAAANDPRCSRSPPS